jgi:uncharacterized membrane protein (UPF0136 family)
MKRFQRWLVLSAYAFNILGLFAGLMGYHRITSQISRPDGATVFFSVVLIVAPVLSIVVFAEHPWVKSD